MSLLPPRLLVIVGETYERTGIADRLIEAIANRMRREVQDLTMEVIGPRQFRDRGYTIEYDERWTHVVFIAGRAEEDAWFRRPESAGRQHLRRLPVILVITPITELSWADHWLVSEAKSFHVVELDDGIRYFTGQYSLNFERAVSQIARIILDQPEAVAEASPSLSTQRSSREPRGASSSTASYSETPSRPDPDTLQTLIARRGEAEIKQINIPKAALNVPIFPETPEASPRSASLDGSEFRDSLRPQVPDRPALPISNMSRWIVLGASIGALSAAALFLYRRNDADNVELAAFAPQTCGRGEIILIQALLHLPADRESARLMAVAADPATVHKAAQTLSMAVRRGEKLEIDLEADGCHIDEARQTAIWRGGPVSVQFFATVPRQRKKPIPVRITAIRSRVPVGSIRFTVPIEADASKKPIEIRGESAKRFERAFVSYASEDRVSVLKYAQVLNISGIEIFQDVLSLEPGDRWERRLYGEIDRSDLFLLFWSKAASESKWVVAEAEYALRYYNKTGSRKPVIRPILLEGPPIPKIPATLKSIHFNDRFRYLILGAKAEADARRQPAN
jgi:hypothetical protein